MASSITVKEGRIWNYHLAEEGSDTSLCGKEVVKTSLTFQHWENKYHEEYQLSYCNECEEIHEQ